MPRHRRHDAPILVGVAVAVVHIGHRTGTVIGNPVHGIAAEAEPGDPGEAAEVAETVEEALAGINSQVSEQYEREIKKLEADYRKLIAEHEKQQLGWKREAKPLYRRIAKSLDERRPHLHEFDWSEAGDGDEDDDPLFDTTRDYVEQIDAYKSYQGKPTTRRSRRKTTGED
jgi:hypothetical protein